MSKVINIELDCQIRLNKSQLPGWLIDQIRSYLTMENPKFREANDHGYSTWDIDQHIFAYQETKDELICYRGYLGSLISFLCQAGYRYQLIDNRRKLPEVKFTFKGNLREYQTVPVKQALQKHFGVLVAPCGSGKTVMACAIIVQRRQPTLIICHTKELLNQWRDRIEQYLGLSSDEIGIIGAGKENIRPVSVAMVQTLVKRDLEEIRQHFGQIIVDECQHAPASTFIEVASAFDSFYMLGLSATPYRRDRLNKLIFLSLGNVVAEVKDSDLHNAGCRIRPEIIVRETGFDFDYQEDADYQPMIGALVADRDRNQLIANDVVFESADGKNFCLVLSDRKAHLHDLASLIKSEGIEAEILTADVPKKQREQIVRDMDTGALQVVLATSQLAGEGLDIPRLNRLFVTTPIKWKGRLIQYVGRALRTAEGKSDARIFDYVDSNVGILLNSFRSRKRVYEGVN